jgi:hypothetical protein
MPTALTLLDNAPIHSAGKPRFVWAAAPDTVDLYDVRGQRVFTDRFSGVPSGWSTFTLRSDNGAGGSLASGVYFLRVTAIGQVQSQRLVVIR